MQPSHKNPQVEAFLQKVSNRTTSIRNDVCVPAPIGCGGPATDFKDEVSRREYTISGLCQKCQDSIFNVCGGPEQE